MCHGWLLGQASWRLAVRRGFNIRVCVVANTNLGSLKAWGGVRRGSSWGFLGAPLCAAPSLLCIYTSLLRLCVSVYTYTMYVIAYHYCCCSAAIVMCITVAATLLRLNPLFIHYCVFWVRI